MNKKTLISIEKYSTWVLCNVIFCILPIGIIWCIGKLTGDLNLPIVFSSILAFLFTLMIISIYNFSPFPILKRGSIGEEILIFGSFFVTIVVLVLFVLYNVMPELQQLMNANMQYWVLLLLALVLAVLLNRPAIEDRIEKKEAAVKVADAFREGKKRRKKWISIITSGGGK